MKDRLSKWGHPKDWLRYAVSDLNAAKTSAVDQVMNNTLCYLAQQAIEKALKAVILYHRIEIIKTHVIADLIDVLPNDVVLPEFLTEAKAMTKYAIVTRYPGDYEFISDEAGKKAIDVAEKVVNWVKEIIEKNNTINIRT